MSKFAPAITELENRKEVMDTNAPRNEQLGNKTQAALERKIAASCKSAMEVLQNSPTGKRLRRASNK